MKKLKQLLKKLSITSKSKKLNNQSYSLNEPNPFPTKEHSHLTVFKYSLLDLLRDEEIEKILNDLERRVLAEAKTANRKVNFDYVGIISPVEACIQNQCRQSLDGLLLKFALLKKGLEKEKENAERDFENLVLDDLIQYHKEAQQVKLSDRLDELRIKYLQDKSYRNTTIEQNNERIINIEEILKEKFDNDDPEKDWYNNKILYNGSIAGLFVADSVSIYYCIRDTQPIAEEFVPLITFVLSFGLGLSARALGQSWGKNDLPKLYVWGSVSSLLILPLFILRLLEGGGTYLALLLIAFFLMGIAITYMRSKTSRHINLINELNDLNSENKKLEADNQICETSYAEQRKVHEESNTINVKKLANEEKSNKKLLVDKLQASHQALENLEANVIERVNNICEIAVIKCRNIVYRSRKRAGLEPKPIDNESGEYFFKEKVQSTNINKKQPNGIGKVVLFLFALTLPLLSCSNPPESKDCRVLIDLTQRAFESPNFEKSVRSLPHYIFNEIGVDTTDLVIQDGINIVVSFITDKSMPPECATNLIKWPLRGRIHKERRIEVKKFWQNIDYCVKQIPELGEGLSRTFVNYSLCRQLSELANSQSDVRILVCMSDMLQHNPEANISFYDYRDDPDRIMQEKEKIAEALSADCPLPSIEGISIKVIHSPEVDDLLFQKVREFWTYYLTKKGATISFVPGI